METNYTNMPLYPCASCCRSCQGCQGMETREEWHGMPYQQPSQFPGRGPARGAEMRTYPNQAMPYYMAHPYPMFMQGDEDDERDLMKLQSMFPKNAQLVQPLVEDACDRMEYDGSLMFDEYPDKLQMERMIENIYQQLQNSSVDEQMFSEEEISAMQCRNCNGNRFGDGLQDLISVMLFEEMHRRRCRRRKCKRWW